MTYISCRQETEKTLNISQYRPCLSYRYIIPYHHNQQQQQSRTKKYEHLNSQETSPLTDCSIRISLLILGFRTGLRILTTTCLSVLASTALKTTEYLPLPSGHFNSYDSHGLCYQKKNMKLPEL